MLSPEILRQKSLPPRPTNNTLLLARANILSCPTNNEVRSSQAGAIVSIFEKNCNSFGTSVYLCKISILRNSAINRYLPTMSTLWSLSVSRK